MKIAFGMIVFNGEYVLRQCLESAYPFASQILIAEGPVQYWQDQGYTTSTDGTNEILESFPDPENKITVVHGQYFEKDEQCNAYMPYLADDIDYLWQIDSDEMYLATDIEKMIQILEEEKYTSVDVKSASFYGGLDRYIGGFERKKGNFYRIFKVYPGSKWLTHRPPTMVHVSGQSQLVPRHLDADTLYEQHGIQMFHYSYVFPHQVKAKLSYYKAKVSMGKCVDNYYERIYLPWVLGNKQERRFIEHLNNGVHEFKPQYREHTRTEPFEGDHPRAIRESLSEIKERIENELQEFRD